MRVGKKHKIDFMLDMVLNLLFRPSMNGFRKPWPVISICRLSSSRSTDRLDFYKFGGSAWAPFEGRQEILSPPL